MNKNGFLYNMNKKYAIIFQGFHPNLQKYSLDEIHGLAKSAGYSVFSFLSQNLKKLNSATFLGTGKITQIRTSIKSHFSGKIKDSEDIWKKIDLYQEFDDEFQMDTNPVIHIDFPSKLKSPKDITIIFNNRLYQNQIMNLQGIWGTNVIDRDELILKIFEKNAKTRESKLQIQKARINMEAKIIKRETGLHFDEKQGRGFQGKGLSGWEPHIRAYRRQMRKIDIELDLIAKRRHLQRKRRWKFFNVGIVGYTNAGKSTLLNQLGRFELETANEEFTTIIPRSRKVIMPILNDQNGYSTEELIFTDSVGFICDMSDLLINAFLSTLEELKFSNLLLIILDISENNFNEIMLKLDTTFEVLEKISAHDIEKVLVLNKIDKLTQNLIDERITMLESIVPNLKMIPISALQKQGFQELKKRNLKTKASKKKLRLPYKSRKQDINKTQHKSLTFFLLKKIFFTYFNNLRNSLLEEYPISKNIKAKIDHTKNFFSLIH